MNIVSNLVTENKAGKEVRHLKAANNSWSSDNKNYYFQLKIQFLTGKILALSDTVTGHLWSSVKII